MCESLTRENVFVQEAGLKMRIFLPANFTGYMVFCFITHQSCQPCERKLKVTHDEMMRIVAKQLPYLVNGNFKVPMATDDETGFIAAIDDHLTNVRRLLC